MPDVRPFRGWRYDSAVAGPLDLLICPPFDVISPAQERRLLERHSYNAIHLELGPGAADTARANNRYARAAATLDSWIAGGILRRETDPCLYVYQQRFTVDGQTRDRLAVFAAVRLSPWAAGEVLPHEETHDAPKKDRLALLDATRTNISPIYALCDGGLPGVTALFRIAASRLPDAEATDEEGERHRLWVIGDPAIALAMRDDLARRPLYIADGHHRYETALAYASAHGDDGGPEGAGYVLMAVSPVDDPGLVVLPTHRLVRDLAADRVAYALTRLHEFFHVEIVEDVPPAEPLLAALAGAAGEHALGLYTGNLARLLRPRQTPPELLPYVDPAAQGLDVALLQALLFEELLGLTPDDLRRQRHVDYTRDAGEALRHVDGGEAQLAVILNPTPLEALVAVARAGARLPQKATYLYPKLATGLVLRRFDG